MGLSVLPTAQHVECHMRLLCIHVFAPFDVPVEVEGDDPQSIEASCAGKSDKGHTGHELGPSKIVSESRCLEPVCLVEKGSIFSA